MIYTELLAGLSASIISSAVFHPLDVIKINQIHRKESILTICRRLYKSNAGKFNNLCRFYKALPINCLAYSLTYGIYFPINKYFKTENPLDIQYKYMLYMISTFPATATAITVANPLWTIKSIQMANDRPITIRDCIKDVFNRNGLLGFQKGLFFGYLNSLNGILTFTLYDILKDQINAQTSTQYSICSAISKTIAYFITFPILSLRIQQQISQETFRNILVRQFSFKNFSSNYYGLSVTLIQMVPKTMLMMVLYEKFILMYNI